MLKETVKKEELQEKPKGKSDENTKPEGSNWSTSTPPGYREEM